jgi:hypothetical protein
LMSSLTHLFFFSSFRDSKAPFRAASIYVHSRLTRKLLPLSSCQTLIATPTWCLSTLPCPKRFERCPKWSSWMNGLVLETLTFLWYVLLFLSSLSFNCFLQLNSTHCKYDNFALSDGRDYSTFRCEIQLRRKPGFYLQKVVALVMIIGMMLCGAFIVPPVSISDRIQITITLFLSAVRRKRMNFLLLTFSLGSLQLCGGDLCSKDQLQHAH